ncbi:Aldo/keto reductase [Aspergillus caelatus]|uniref:D-xylose reductase [NAD(P)H] n=1 Tax=Aspergillus caelatus TaxID=61420 RepID=A0A5N7AK74_9EURO|nr:Aldo/keto reductase [Aspergillus caelatus]KAE8370292.1 Aldo/keto reductase [Aspergillus caelatus]
MPSTDLSKKGFSLNSGYTIPAIGLGTWQSKPGEVEKAVEAALRCGYRHIDTATAYGNEAEVGAGIRASGVPREEIFLTTKLHNQWHMRVSEALDQSLQKLRTNYVDLYLVHWPCATDPGDLTKVVPDWDYVQTWAEMQKLLSTKKVKSIGVSNFGIMHLERLLHDSSCQVIPAVNQIELHPNRPSPKLVAYNTLKGIHSTAYSCLGSTGSPLYKNQTLLDLAQAKGRSVQQVLIRWGLQKGWSVIPKSVNPDRIKGNLVVDGWDLTDREMAAIDAIPQRFKVCDGSFLPPVMHGKIFYGDDE